MKKMSIFFLGLVLLLGCENHSKDDLVILSEFSTYEIGKMHNELLAYSYSKNMTFMTNEQVLLLFEEYLVSEKNYDKVSVQESIKKMESTPEYTLLLDSKSSIDQSNISTYLNAVKKHFNPSDKLMNALKQAFILAEDSDPADVKSFVIYNITNKTWTGIDRDLAHVFTDVFMHSYDYWTEVSERKLNKASKVILYDAGGALHGLIFGPVGSIIEGALLSVAASERLPDDK
jgi:hypothetical protein